AEPGGCVVVHRDITARRRSLAELEAKASRDALTGLLNRAALEDEARQRIEEVRDVGAPIGAIFVDLDDFKLVNDRFGHAVGDGVRKLVAKRLTGAMRGGDLVARQGGDEFVIILHPLPGPNVAARLADRIVATISEPIRPDDAVLTITASVGVVVLD